MRTQKQLSHQIVVYILLFFSHSTVVYSDQSELINLSVEDLLNVEVTTVAKKSKSLNDTPAAIFVINQSDIKRIGATSIPEALRLAPGLDVSRIDTNKWAVTARGFNSRFANKLLVLIDGRNTYTRTFAGTYWENQDVMLEDVERVEVIRGSGTALWGANAVNGVINIITKHSSDTQGGLLVAGGGTEEQGFGAFRYGHEFSPDTTARVYVKGYKRDESTHQSGGEAGDDGEHVQAGFRTDSQLTQRDSLTVQGDIFHNTLKQNTTLPQLSFPFQNNLNEKINSFGGNLLARHQHTFSSTSDYSVQFYYDFYKRGEVLNEESRHTVDFDFQHRFDFLNWNDVVWGAGYRYIGNKFSINDIGKINSPSQNDQVFSAFIQDEITLVDNYLWLTVGSKFEHNDYSGFEYQPTARLMWAPHYQHRIWAAVSRAVRTPARSEQEANILVQAFPPQAPFTPLIAVQLEADQNYDSEDVLSYEIGYRTTLIDNVSIDFTAFYNEYTNVRSSEIGEASFNGIFVEQSIFFDNKHSAQTYGFEISTVWQMLDWWRWDINYSLLKMEFDSQIAAELTGVSPQQRASLRSSLSPIENIDLDLFLRYVDTNIAQELNGDGFINAYFSLDVRLAWRPINGVELSLVGQNLLAGQHLEYKQETYTSPTEIDRGMYGKISWEF